MSTIENIADLEVPLPPGIHAPHDGICYEIFSGTSTHQCAHQDRENYKISVRNVPRPVKKIWHQLAPCASQIPDCHHVRPKLKMKYRMENEKLVTNKFFQFNPISKTEIYRETKMNMNVMSVCFTRTIAPVILSKPRQYNFGCSVYMIIIPIFNLLIMLLAATIRDSMIKD